MKIKELAKVLKKLDQEKEVFLSSDPEGNNFGSLSNKLLFEHTIQEGERGYVLFPIDTIHWEDIEI
jgi:hypothetical protein